MLVPPPVTAVILGGGRQDALALRAGVAAKALVPFAGQALALYVLSALRACPAVAHIVYVGDADSVIAAQADQLVPPGETFVESFSAGAHAALAHAPEHCVLVTTADLPWLRREALDDFLAAASGAALAYPVVRREVAEAQFPEQRRTFVRLQEGRFTGGNLMLLAPEMVPALLPFVERAYGGRKNPLALARLFGADFIVRLALGRLSLGAIEARATQLLGLPVRAVITPFASIGADVDKPEHLTTPLSAG
jgi:molybdopterin-guanine dinucleotide biosynthesis protein A